MANGALGDDAATDDAKRALRGRLLRERAGIGTPEREASDAAIARQLRALPAWRGAAVVLTYLSFGSEVETRALVRAGLEAGKLVALPRCEPRVRTMRWYRVDGLDGLERSALGMDEPPEDPGREVLPAHVGPAIAIVPGLAFDGRGHRLGYGGGYYDRFLSRFEGVSVGLCREAQLVGVGELPLGAHDLPVDLVVTESRVIVGAAVDPSVG